MSARSLLHRARVARLFAAWLPTLLAGCYTVNVGHHDGGADPCATARRGGACASEGARCSGGCGGLVCAGGRWVDAEPCDAGPCECPPAPEGCRYVGMPCPCSELICSDEPCGRVRCRMGTVCCNASCGLCTPPGTACSLEACEPDCSPQDARGEGSCETVIGWAWNGRACVPLSGCSCVGGDCPNLFRAPGECEAYFGACPQSCGGFVGAACPPSHYCDFEETDPCGGGDGTGVCRPRPDICPPVIAEVCGCDGRDYRSPCDAHAAGVDVAREGPCPRPCTPDDATGVGACRLLLGYRWDGRTCAPLVGCECRGADCSVVLDRSEETCLAAHAACPSPLPGV